MNAKRNCLLVIYLLIYILLLIYSTFSHAHRVSTKNSKISKYSTIRDSTIRLNLHPTLMQIWLNGVKTIQIDKRTHYLFTSIYIMCLLKFSKNHKFYRLWFIVYFCCCDHCELIVTQVPRKKRHRQNDGIWVWQTKVFL